MTYFVGEYSENKFIPERQGLVDFGDRYYAPQVMVDESGRRLMFGWIQEGRSTEAHLEVGWAGVQAIPRELSLAPDGGMASVPIPETTSLRGKSYHWEDIQLEAGKEMPLLMKGNGLEIQVEFVPGEEVWGLKVLSAPGGREETTIAYDGARQVLMLDLRHSSLDTRSRLTLHEAPTPLRAGEVLRLQVFIDHSVVEVIANNRYSLTGRVYPTRGDTQEVKIFSSSGSVKVKGITVWEMGNFWLCE